MTETALWYSKYRPHTLDEYIWPSPDLEKRVRGWIANPANLPQLILGGPPGVGKTSLALLIAEQLGMSPGDGDFLVQNSSSETGVENIRSTIEDFCQTGGFGGIKLVLLDEAEGLSPNAVKALRGVINDYGDYVRFWFTTNDLRKMHPALKSRARVIEVDALDQERFLDRLAEIAMAEQISLDVDVNVDALATIVDRTYPDMRKAIDTLQDAWDGNILDLDKKAQVKPESATEGLVLEFIGGTKSLSEIREIVGGIRREEFEPLYEFLYGGVDSPMEVVVIADHLHRHLSTATYADINFLACLCKLAELQRGQS